MSDFSDPSDRASIEEERELARRISMSKVALQRRAIEPKGKCYFCDEPFEGGKENPRLFCDSDCAADHERMEFNRRQRME